MCHRSNCVEFVGDELVRDLFRPAVGAGTAVGIEQLVEPRITSGFRGAGYQAQRDVVEGALHVEDRRQFGRAHPEDAEAPVVGHQFARSDGVNVLGRKSDADDLERLQSAVEDRFDFVAGFEMFASAKASLTRTSPRRPGSTQRPLRR